MANRNLHPLTKSFNRRFQEEQLRAKILSALQGGIKDFGQGQCFFIPKMKETCYRSSISDLA